MKILFDNSIHLGQFAIHNEALRIAAKNSQIQISMKPGSDCVGIESFNENTFSDDIIWGLDREVQDAFYPFMDLFHSVKNVQRIPLFSEDALQALKISQELEIDLSNALTCAIAIRTEATEIHSFYPEFQKEHMQQYLQKEGIVVNVFLNTNEQSFSDPMLEQCYQEALSCFEKNGIDLTIQFHV
jgi:hypothetical protein